MIISRKIKTVHSLVVGRKYEEAFRLCEQSRRKSPEILYMGACALFGLGHIHQADDWVSQHGILTEHDASFLYLDAYIQLHNRNFQKALLNWTRILQLDPSQTLADTLIDRLKSGEENVFREISKPESFIRFIPLPENSEDKDVRDRRDTSDKRSINIRKIILAALGITLIGIMLGLFFAFSSITSRFFKTDPFHKLDDSLPREPADGKIVSRENIKGKLPRFYYENNKLVLRDYAMAREKIIKGEINQARYLLGRIELSNAGFEIKERALLLRDMIPHVKRKDFKDPCRISQILKEPYMLRGAIILWKGRVAAFSSNDAGARFVFRELSRPDVIINVLLPYQKQHKPQAIANLKDGQIVGVYGVFEKKISTGRIIVRALEIVKE